MSAPRPPRRLTLPRLGLLLAACLSGTPLLHADGHAAFADAAAAPAGTSKWNDPQGTGWINDGTRYCYTRKTGVGLPPAKNGIPATGLKRTFGTLSPEAIRELDVTCGAATVSARGKNLPLQVTLSLTDGTEAVQQLSYRFEDGHPQTQTFTWPAPQSVTAVRLDNLHGSNVFEVAALAWRADTLPLHCFFSLPPEVTCGQTFAVSADNRTGGRPPYTARLDIFGSTYPLEEGPQLTLTAPDRPGTYPAVLTLQDADGTPLRIERTLQVIPSRRPAPPTVSDITGTGFRLSWPPYPGDVRRYELSVRSDREVPVLELPLPPAAGWQTGDGRRTAAFDLSAYTHTQSLGTVILLTDEAFAASGAVPTLRLGPHTDIPPGSTLIGFTFATPPNGPVPDTLVLSIPEDAPIPQGTLHVNMNPAVREVTLLGPNTLTAAYGNLPRGLPIRVELAVRCRAPDLGGEPQPDNVFRSDDLLVQLLPLPGLRGMRLGPTGTVLHVGWPEPREEYRSCTGCVTVKVRPEPDPPVENPLRLTGVAYIKGGTPARLHRLYALSNVGRTPVTPAEAGYSIKAVRSTGTETSAWSFKPTRTSPDAGTVYTVPPGGTLVLDAGEDLPATLCGNPVGRPGGPQALTCGPGAAVTLRRNGIPVGPPLSLTEGTLTQTADGEITAVTVPDPEACRPLFAPPAVPKDDTVLTVRTYTFPMPAGDSHAIDLAPALRRARELAAEHGKAPEEIFAEGTLREDGTASEPVRLTLWHAGGTPSPPGPRPGFRLRLR